MHIALTAKGSATVKVLQDLRILHQWTPFCLITKYSQQMSQFLTKFELIYEKKKRHCHHLIYDCANISNKPQRSNINSEEIP